MGVTVGESKCCHRGGVLANALCDIWCGKVVYFHKDWLWTSGCGPVGTLEW